MHKIFKQISSMCRLKTGKSEAQTASVVFYAIIGLTIVMFALFRFVGFDRPYDDNPDYNAPLFTGTLITFMCLLVAATLGIAIWSACNTWRKNGNEGSVVNKIPARKIALTVGIGMVAALALMFATGSTTPLAIGGHLYDNALALRTADMFINTAILLIVIAVGAVIFGATQHKRK